MNRNNRYNNQKLIMKNECLNLSRLPLTREESRKELIKMKLPAAALDVFDGKFIHAALSYRCEEPYFIFSASVLPEGIHITPLWERGSIVTAYQHSWPHGRFITFNLEDPKDVTVIGPSFKSVVAALLIDLWENEKSDQELREVARLFAFRHLDELLRECESRARLETFAGYCEWRANFCELCDAA